MEGLAIGRFRITRRLGAGGMAEVYEAKHEYMDRYAAVKMLRPEMSARDIIVKRFFQEAQAAASIEHPGIVHVYDVGHMPDGRAYLVMELLSGETLSQRLQRHKRLSLEASVTVIRQLAGVMGAAHQRGIVHRDLKPDNIFLVPDPEMPSGERVKVLDFGLAKLLEVAFPHRELTAQGSVFGTPAYMAPEQCRSSGNVDQRADLYAIGCIFYMCLCGHAPFGTGGIEVLLAHVGQQPVPPRQHVPDIPAGIEELILQLLAKDPDQRLPSCETFIAQLDRVVEMLPSGFGRGRSDSTDEMTMRDNPTLQGALAFAVRQVATAPIAANRASTRPGSGAERDAPPAQRPRRPPTGQPAEPTQHLNTQALVSLDVEEDTDRVSVPPANRKVAAGPMSTTALTPVDDVEQLSEDAFESIDDAEVLVSGRATAPMAAQAPPHHLPTERLAPQSRGQARGQARGPSQGLEAETRPLRKQEQGTMAATMRLAPRAQSAMAETLRAPPGAEPPAVGTPRGLPGVSDAVTVTPRPLPLPGVPDAMTLAPRALPGVADVALGAAHLPPSAQAPAAAAKRNHAQAMQLTALPWEPNGTGGGMQPSAQPWEPSGTGGGMQPWEAAGTGGGMQPPGEIAGQGENASRASTPTLSSGELERRPRRPPRRTMDRRVVGAIAGLAGVVIVGLVLAFSGGSNTGDDDAPVLLPVKEPTVVPEPVQNPPAEDPEKVARQQTINELQRQVDQAIVAKDWDRAQSLIVELKAAEGQEAQGARLDGLEQRVSAGKQSQKLFEDLRTAAKKQTIDKVLEALRQIPEDSAYRAEALEVASVAVRSRGQRLQRNGDCKALADMVTKAVSELPELQGELQRLSTACAQAAAAAPKAAAGGKRDAGQILADARDAYKDGKFLFASKQCQDLRKLGQVSEDAATVCGLAACKNKDGATAKWYYGRASRSQSKSMIAQMCLKEFKFDVQK